MRSRLPARPRRRCPRLLGREVRVRMGRRGGAVEIPFDDIAELSEIARRISGRMAA